MNENIIPRKHRKHAMKLLNKFHSQDKICKLEDYLRFLWIGTQDGWLRTNNREYRALNWLRGKVCEKRSGGKGE